MVFLARLSLALVLWWWKTSIVQRQDNQVLKVLVGVLGSVITIAVALVTLSILIGLAITVLDLVA